jgi:hypothetical protein
MRLPLPCVECVRKKADPNTGLFSGCLVFVEMEGEHLFRLTCSDGHSSTLGLQQPRFELLFESGAMALLDGYYREAVASFASALERFHEYWFRATLLEAGVAPGAIASMWKIIAKQSERQYGAFLALHVRETNGLPRILPDQWVTFRNDIVHKGLFPSAQKAQGYGEEVLHMIAELWKQLEKTAAAGVAALRSEQSEILTSAGAYPGEITTILSRAEDLLPKVVSLKDELPLLDKRRRGEGGALVAS